MIDSLPEFCHSARMSLSLKKLIAVLLAIWLPLMTGNSLAASISMQLQQGSCHEMDMGGVPSEEEHHHPGIDRYPSVADQSPDQLPDQFPGQQDTPCNNCGICHLACSGYLVVPDIKTPTVPQSGSPLTAYLFSFHSITTLPLLPPPLTRA